MGWFGKIVGGTLGFAIGGPLGAIAGAALGHTFDVSRDQYYEDEAPRHTQERESFTIGGKDLFKLDYPVYEAGNCDDPPDYGPVKREKTFHDMH